MKLNVIIRGDTVCNVDDCELFSTKGYVRIIETIDRFAIGLSDGKTTFWTYSKHYISSRIVLLEKYKYSSLI